MAAKFVLSQPALAPLFAAVGLGVVGSGAFAYHHLTNSPEVVVNKRVKEPWNSVSQGKNTKLMSFNQDFWASRVNLPDPRAAFLQESKDDAGALARAKARKVSKEDTVAH